MTVVLCYTGFLRSWQTCAANHWHYLAELNKADAYFYTYELPYIQVNDLQGSISSYPIKQFVQCQHPFYDDPFAAHKFDSNKAGESKVHHTYNMMHNNLVGFSLIPKGYDVYVRIRPDIKFNGPLKFSDHETKPNTVYIPKGNDYRGINDQFAFGDYDSMRKYYSVYLNCADLYNDGILFNSEVMHLANLNKLGVNIIRLEHPQHDIVR